MNFMPALSNTCFLPSRPTPVASTKTSLVSEPLAPAFMRNAPPMGPGMPKKNSSPADIGRGRRFGHALVERRGASADDIAVGAALAETTRTEANDHARQAAITHDQVGADADDIDRQFVRQACEEIRQIILV